VVAGAALTAALALVALPGLAGSRSPSTARAIDAATFHDVTLSAQREAPLDGASLDPALRSAGHLGVTATLIDPGLAPELPAKPEVRQPTLSAASVLRPAKQVLTGGATFYDNGTTAMRLPRGTRVVICGDGGCIERIVTDYGPQKPSRIVDLYRPDFFEICGCPWHAGNTEVTVYVY
jgi:hypothetical protein